MQSSGISKGSFDDEFVDVQEDEMEDLRELKELELDEDKDVNE